MKVNVLISDTEELERAGISLEEAFGRGYQALAARPTRDKPREKPNTPEGLEELAHLHAEAAADMRLLQFAYTTKAGAYARSRGRYYAVESAMADVQRELVPRLRARLRELRAREATLERELRERGIDANSIGPKVPKGTAIGTDPTSGKQAPYGSAITLIVSVGPETFPCPNFVGMTLDGARAVAKAHGLAVAALPVPGARDHTIVTQVPSPGETVRYGATITLYYA